MIIVEMKVQARLEKSKRESKSCEARPDLR